jgi:hypothetical protein
MPEQPRSERRTQPRGRSVLLRGLPVDQVDRLVRLTGCYLDGHAVTQELGASYP